MSPVRYCCQFCPDANPLSTPTGVVEGNGISVLKSDFTYLKKDQPVQRDYIIVRNAALEFPIYLYKFSDEEYSAILMKCSHQGNELQAVW